MADWQVLCTPSISGTCPSIFSSVATNGEVIFVCIVGGVGTFFGPIVGAVAFLLLHDYLQVVFTRWELVVGMVLIFFILFFNEGIVGRIENRIASYREKRAARMGSGQGGGC